MANKLTMESLDKTFSTIGVLLDRIFQNEKKWFVCFGTLLGMIRDRGIVEGDQDIDIGIMQEDMNEKKLMSVFSRYNYALKKIIRMDGIDKTITLNMIKPDIAYMCFTHDKLPTIDIFGFILHNGIRYHTYDFMNENKEYPSKYVWKGVEDKFFKRIERSRFGTTKKPIFSRNVPFPFMYGHLLDTWYPDWKTARPGESHTPYMLEMKSCKAFKDKAFVAAQLEKSWVVHEDYLRSVK